MQMKERWMALVGLTVFMGGALTVYAQAGAGEVQTTTLWGLIRQGGWIMIPLGLLSVAMVGLAVYGFLSVREDKLLRLDMLQSIQSAVRALDFQRAASICNGNPSVLTNVLAAGLNRTSQGSIDTGSMTTAMEDAAVEETTAAMRPISYLSIIAQVAPMLGLLGTVNGMIGAFQKIGLGAMGDPERLASDIGEAMVTTATGLIIGIPAMFLYFFLKSRFNGTMSRMSRILGNIMHDLDVALVKVPESKITLPDDAPTTPEAPPQPKDEKEEGETA